MVISVTAEHIAKGKRGLCYECPVALALSEATRESWQVNAESVSLYTPTYKRISLHSEIASRIARFDEQGEMVPFTFELRI